MPWGGSIERTRRSRPRSSAKVGCARFTSTKLAGNAGSLRSPAVDVVLLHWPADQARRDELHAAGSLRLLLVEGDALPPLPSDDSEDWIRHAGPVAVNE